MRLFSSNNSLFPGRGPRLSGSHPMCLDGSLRIATVARGSATMFDLQTNKIGSTVASIVGGYDSVLGPYATTGGAVGGLAWPAIKNNEQPAGMTLAGIIGIRGSQSAGQHFVNSQGGSLDTSPPTFSMKLSTGSSGFYFYEGGSQIFQTFITSPYTAWPALTVGHNYLVIGSIALSGISPLMKGVIRDLTTGQIYVSAFASSHQPSFGQHYQMVSYDTTGGSAANFLAAGAISARALSFQEMLSWAQNDPWGLWYDAPALSILMLGGSIIGVPGVNNLHLVANDAIETLHATVTNSGITPPPVSSMDMHDGGPVPEHILERWRQVGERNRAKDEPPQEEKPYYKPSKVLIRRLKAKPTVHIRRLKQGAEQ